MGVDPPFIYDRPSAYTFGAPTDSRAFNPKAVSQASWSPKAPRPKPTGPLIDFNRHPDSYLIVPYGNLNVKPMSPKTQARVKRARFLQLFLRICALLGALGALFCVIAINNVSSGVGWIIRIAPAVALCHTVYGIYHLCRSATGRTPASTASYMVFAAMVDTGLIPFFVFCLFLAHEDYTANTYKWGTLFNDATMTTRIIFGFYIVSAIECGLLVTSLFMDVYLAILFRQIAKLPPDMNPLEPNLTARPNKHKKNKSEITLKQMNASAMVAQNEAGVAGTRRVPFIHTRTDSVDSVTLFGNESARQSRVSFRKELDDKEQDPYRLSHSSGRDTIAPTRPSSAVNPSTNARPAGAGLEHKPARPSGLAQTSRPASWLSYMDYEGMPTPLSEAARFDLDNEVRPISPISPLASGEASPSPSHAERQNWYQGSPRRDQVEPSSDENHLRVPIPVHDLVTVNVHQSGLMPPPKRRSREPLGMNPPTPTMNAYTDENVFADKYAVDIDRQSSDTHGRIALHDTDLNSPARPSLASRPASFVGSGGKSRFYGNLRSSIGSIGPVTMGEKKQLSVEITEIPLDDYARTGTMESASDYSGNIEIFDDNSEDEIDNNDRSRQNVPAPVDQPRHWNGARQTSNSTGYDLGAGYAGLGAEFGQGMGRRREVSGKVAEEGRVIGYGGRGVSEVRDGGVATGQRNHGGAAGWARFKGL